MCKLQSASIYSLHILERGECANTLYIMLTKVEVCCIISLLETIVMHAHSLAVLSWFLRRP
jgi:hypothetical protein